MTQDLDDWIRESILRVARRSGEHGVREFDLRRALTEDSHDFPGRIIRLRVTDLQSNRQAELIREAVDYLIAHHRLKIVRVEKQPLHQLWATGRTHCRYLKCVEVLDSIVDATKEPASIMVTLPHRALSRR